MATTLTPATAGAELLDRLRQLAERETPGTLDEVRAIADELTAVLRRARGRIRRLAPKPARTPSTPKEPLSATVTATVRRGARLVARVARTAARLAFAALRRRIAAPSSAPPPAEHPAPAGAREPVPRAVEDPPEVPDLNSEQAAGLACIVCNVDFWTTGTLKLPAGVAESTGDPVFVCVGACAASHTDSGPLGEQLPLAAGL